MRPINARLSNLKILVVDDHMFVASVFQQTLVSHGAEDVKIAKDGQKAVELLNSMNFDVIVTDINMPRLNGIQLLKLIRTGKLSQSRAIPVVLLTGHSHSDVLKVCLKLDANGFIVKPCSKIKTLEHINKALNNKIQLKNADYYEMIGSSPEQNTILHG